MNIPVARFFLQPHHVGYHVEHHLYPGVPHYNLQKLHELLRETPEFAEANVVRGYGRALRELIH